MDKHPESVDGTEAARFGGTKEGGRAVDEIVDDGVCGQVHQRACDDW